MFFTTMGFTKGRTGSEGRKKKGENWSMHDVSPP